jgi:hypothetical protein
LAGEGSAEPGRGQRGVARGTVKRFSGEKGYGFIAPEEGKRTCSSTTGP